MQSYFYVIWLGANEEKARGINVCAAAAAGQQCSSLSEHHHISEQCQAPAQRVYFNAENSQEEGRKKKGWAKVTIDWLLAISEKERENEEATRLARLHGSCKNIYHEEKYEVKRADSIQ